MAQYLNDISRTFSEYLLIPGLTTKECTHENISLKAPLVKFKAVRHHRLISMSLLYQLLCSRYPTTKWLSL